MSWHMIRIFWLSLIALVLPAQALASLDNHKSASGKAAATLSALLHQSDEPESPSQPQAPQSETHYTGSKAALINSVRWTRSAGYNERAGFNGREGYNGHNGEPDLLDTVAPFYPVTDPHQTIHLAQSTAPAPYQDFHSSYRLSGWKETNAMYVALNSQYFC